MLRYADKRRQHSRSLRVARHTTGTTLEALLLAGDTRAGPWLMALLKDHAPTQLHGRQLLMPGQQAPADTAPRGRQVCTCFSVDESAILAALAHIHGDARTRLEKLQAQLRCGTNCGSCVPALNQLITKNANERATI